MSQFRAAPLLRNRASICVLIVIPVLLVNHLVQSFEGAPGRRSAGRKSCQKSIGGAVGA
jgi:hypothetical protein